MEIGATPVDGQARGCRSLVRSVLVISTMLVLIESTAIVEAPLLPGTRRLPPDPAQASDLGPIA